MAGTVFLESDHGDDERRRRLYAGDLYVFGQRRSVLDLAEFARRMIVEAFFPRDPETAQFEMGV